MASRIFDVDPLGYLSGLRLMLDRKTLRKSRINLRIFLDQARNRSPEWAPAELIAQSS